MTTRRITRPTLADLWRHLLATLECLGADDAPAMARSLAVSGLVGRPATAMGVRVRRSGEVVTITSNRPSASTGLRATAMRMGAGQAVAGRRSRSDAEWRPRCPGRPIESADPDSSCDVNRPLRIGLAQPVRLQPGHLGLQGLAPPVEGAEHRPPDGRQVGQPAALVVGLDVAGPGDRERPEGGQVDLLAVDAPDRAVPAR